MGKGRKERATPLTGITVAVLRGWLAEHTGGPDGPLFPTRTGTRLSHDAIERRLKVHVATARARCPALRAKHVTMHTLRHTAAMRLLHAGVDIVVIALWLGHEQIATTHIYLHADMSQKERAIARVTPPSTTPGRYQPPGARIHRGGDQEGLAGHRYPEIFQQDEPADGQVPIVKQDRLQVSEKPGQRRGRHHRRLPEFAAQPIGENWLRHRVIPPTARGPV